MSHEPLVRPSGDDSAAMAHAPDALYQRVGHLTRQLHDTLGQLGVMPRLQAAADGLPDARSRLNYVAEKTADAAHRVLNAVDAAKEERQALDRQAAALRERLSAHPSEPVPNAEVLAFTEAFAVSSARLDAHLTDIMMAQDFHDLTGQVVRRVLDVANALEDNLVALLRESAPAGHPEPAPAPAQGGVSPAPAPAAGLQGPVVAGTRHGEVLTNQGEVDDLLSSLGF